jgi:nicotinamidase/pyrazinamidase
MGKKALFVVDMLRDFLETDGALHCGPSARKIIPFVSRKIKQFRKKNFPVIYLCDSHQRGDYELKFYRSHAMKGTKGAQIVDELLPQKEDFVITKRCYDGFSNSSLEKKLKQMKIKEVHIVGVCTSICVMENAAGLFYRKIPTAVYKEGVRDFDSKNHQFALKRMKQVYGVRIL